MSYNIVIRHLTGTLKGKDQVITAQEASIGTGPGNTVRLDPVWDKGVAPSHARVFRDAAGAWVLEDAGTRTGTFVNGQRVTSRMPVTGAIVVEFGAGGPKMEILLPPPLPVAGGAGRSHAGAGKSSGGVGKLVLALALIAGLGFAAWKFVGGSKGSADDRLQQVARSYEAGVGLVLSRSGGMEHRGTAWAVAPHLFATNAHVAINVVQSLKERSTPYVAINKRPDQRFRVKEVYLHPAYLRGDVGIKGQDPATDPYDVAILVIEGTAEVTLKMASKEKLDTLDSGHRVAFVGFPMEGLSAGGYDPQNPVAIMQSGIITAVTDFWLAKSSYENRRLVQHNLPTVGGSSGSPIFDADGEVIAVLSSGNMIAAMDFNKWAAYQQQLKQARAAAMDKVVKEVQSAKGNLSTEEENRVNAEFEATMQAVQNVPLPKVDMTRAPSAAMINFGQRVDMLQDLIAMVKKADPSL